MKDAMEFIDAHRSGLLAWLDGKAPESSGDPGALDYVDEVLEAWSSWAEGKILSPPTDEERTFWFALYQLEELVEDPSPGVVDPYEAILMQQLAEVRELLRSNSGLPELLFASRPGEEGDFS